MPPVTTTRGFLKLLMSAGALAIAPGLARAQSTLRISHMRPSGNMLDVDVKAFAYEVTKSTGIKFAIFPDSALGDYIAVQRKLTAGSVDLALQPIAIEQDSRFKIGSLPYLVVDWKDARGKFGRGGNVRKAIEELYERQDIHVLAAYPGYFGGVALAKNPAAQPKGSLRVRVPPQQPHLAAGLGYRPIELPYSEIEAALKAGMIDGLIGSGAEDIYAKFLQHTKYYVVANTHFEVSYLLMNRNEFEDLSARRKEAFASAAAYFESLRWSSADALQSFNEMRLRDSGVVMIRPAAEDMEQVASDMRKNVWPILFDQVGRDYARSILGMQI